MSWRRQISKLQSLFRRAKPGDDLEEEIRVHLKIEEQENRESGMSPEEASFAARRRFGNVASAQERSREMWGWHWLERLFQDLRYGFRQLRRSPMFTVAAILALALGIGVNTTVFTAYKAMVARPLDARAPGEMVNMALTRRTGAPDFKFSYPDYETYRDSVRSFSGLIAFSTEQMRLSEAGGIVTQSTSLVNSAAGKLGLLPSGASNAEFASVFAVSENYFKVLGVPPLRGRSFESMTIAELAHSPSVLISENYWQNRFAGDPAIVGKTIHLNGAAVTVAGVTPRDFVGTGIAVPDFWLPLSLEPLVHADDHWLRDRENQRYRLFGRLVPGASIGQAQAEMTLLADHLRTLHDPHSDAAKIVTALVWEGSPFPLPINLYSGLTPTILFIMGAAAMLLVVACANVGSLQLARARSRQNELRTRLSLGASRLRVIRQLLTESALLGLLAGMVALVFSWALLQVAVTLTASALPVNFGTLVFHVTPDLAIFSYVLAISLIAGILFGLAPALESSRSALTADSRSGTSSARTRRVQDFLIAAQVSLSLVLMIAGSMLVRSAMHALDTDPGYETKHIVQLLLQFPEGPKYAKDRQLSLFHEVRPRLAGLPGVFATTVASSTQLDLLQTVAVADKAQSILYYSYVQSDYFQTLGIPMFLGRGFQSQPEQSVILSESAAKQFWPNENPIGQSIRLAVTDEKPHNLSDLSADGPAYQVVGVARNTRGFTFDGSDSKRIYLPLPDDRLPNHAIFLRTTSDAAQLMKSIERTISSIDPDLVVDSSTMEDVLRQSPPVVIGGLAAAIATAVGLSGLLLASLGIYGTVSYIVVLRTREVGIRMAVGAQKRNILGLVLRESTRPVIGGLLLGMFLAIGESYLLRGILVGLHTVDVVSFAGVSLLFLAITMVAVYPPSRRAMRVDPVVALRYE
jgi:predicted permease